MGGTGGKVGSAWPVLGEFVIDQASPFTKKKLPTLRIIQFHAPWNSAGFGEE